MKIEEIFVAIIIVVVLVFTIVEGINRAEVQECRKFQRMAENYRSFYLTKNEAMQCKAHGIVIKAIIK